MHAPHGSDILAVIKEICSFGPRWMGSEGADKAIGFIADQFEASGLKVERQAFRYLSYKNKKAVIIVNGRRLPCEPIALSHSTIGVLTAPLVFAGQCSQKDLDALSTRGVVLDGAIVLSENLRSFVAYPEVEAVKAAGMVLLTTLPGNTIRCGCARLDRKPGKIPAVAIGGDDGRSIVKRLEKGHSLEASLEVEGHVAEKVGYNVIGRRGDSKAAKVIVTAHYDSFWNGVHAMDNAAGTASVIVLSQLLAVTLCPPVEFVVFGGEELGLWGSSAYVHKNSEELGRIKAVVNLDTFGSNRSQVEIGATSDLIEFCRELAKEHSVHVDCWNVPPRAASDQHSFVKKGVPAIWLANCGSDQRYHTPLDVPSIMSADNIETVVRLALAFIQQLI